MAKLTQQPLATAAGDGDTIPIVQGSILRRISLATVIAKVIALLPANMKGDPGGNIMAVGTLAQLPTINIPAGTNLIQISGGVSDGDGAAGFRLRRVASEPAHYGKAQDKGGQWWALIGTAFPVEFFGAVGDCPDLRAIPWKNQTVIKPAVLGATNDAEAFRRAAVTAEAMGGGEITFGGGKFYRIAFSPTGVNAIVLGNYTTLRQLGGGGLAFDSTLITGVKPTGATPAGWGYPYHGIYSGRAATGLVRYFTAASPAAGFVIADGASYSRQEMCQAPQAIDVHIYCWVRTPEWCSHSEYEAVKLRLHGINFAYANRPLIHNCHTFGLPNGALNIVVSMDGMISKSGGRYTGFGAAQDSPQNTLSSYGYVFVGNTDLSGGTIKFVDCRSDYAKDEGLAYGVHGWVHVTRFVSVGDHDRSVEGDTTWYTSQTAASLGIPSLRGEVRIDGVDQDGQHDIGTGSIAAGSVILTVDDAYFYNRNRKLTASDGTVTSERTRHVFITGAGPLLADGVTRSDGPFTISSDADAVDYVANTVRLTTAPTVSVTNAACYMRSVNGVSHGAGNEANVKMRNIDLKRIYGVGGLVTVNNPSGGSATIQNVRATDAFLGGNYHLVTASAADIVVDGVVGRRITIDDANPNSCGVVVFNWLRFAIRNLDLDAGLASMVATNTSAAGAVRGEIRDSICLGTRGPAIAMGHTNKVGRMIVTDNDVVGINIANSSNNGFIRWARLNQATGVVTIRRNRARWANVAEASITWADGSGNPATGMIDEMALGQNDFDDPAWFVVAYSNVTPVNNYNSPITWLRDDMDNRVPGQRRIVAAGTALPTANHDGGAYHAGDRILVRFPNNTGVATSYICISGGSFVALVSGLTGTTSGTNQDTITLSNAAGLIPGAQLDIPGATLGPFRVVKVTGNVVRLHRPIPEALTNATVSNRLPIILTESVAYTRQAAIASPTLSSPNANEVALKAAIDSLRTALTTVGQTS